MVEDMATVRGLIAERLREIPNVNVVGEAEDAAEALNGIMGTSPDVVILDLHLPGGGGLHVLRELKGLSLPPRVLVFTAYAEEPFRRRCLELGADGFFDKATQAEEMYALIERWAQERAGMRNAEGWITDE